MAAFMATAVVLGALWWLATGRAAGSILVACAGLVSLWAFRHRIAPGLFERPKKLTGFTAASVARLGIIAAVSIATLGLMWIPAGGPLPARILGTIGAGLVLVVVGWVVAYEWRNRT